MPNNDKSPVVKLTVSFLITDAPQMVTSLMIQMQLTQ